MRFSGVIAAAASVASVSAQAQGFNYGATNADGYTARTEASFQKLFTVAQNLVGTSGFTSARLYTGIVRCSPQLYHEAGRRGDKDQTYHELTAM